VSGDWVSTVNERLAGVESTFDTASTARTSKVWAPSVSGSVVNGDEHEAKVLLSRLHWKVDPASVEENSNCGVGLAIRPLGPVLIAVSGGPVSTVNDAWAGLASTFPAGSLARTLKLWGPS